MQHQEELMYAAFVIHGPTNAFRPQTRFGPGSLTSASCEVFCGREPHRGTETCAVVEAMASLEHSFTVLGNASLMDCLVLVIQKLL